MQADPWATVECDDEMIAAAVAAELSQCDAGNSYLTGQFASIVPTRLQSVCISM